MKRRRAKNPLMALPLPLAVVGLGVGLVAAWEGLWYLKRKSNRYAIYNEAKARALELNRPLVVVGAPDGGSTWSPCGDITLDIAPSTACPNVVVADITKMTPFADNSVVVMITCVLEYVSDFSAAYQELQRISGGELYVCRVEPWTLTGYFYPGAKRTVPRLGKSSR